jgi:thiamine-phosphate diphosphorylase / hydroxyethylthiazole kinase
MSIDYSLYLVTDSTEALLRGRNLVDVVQAAIKGGNTDIPFVANSVTYRNVGVTIVQFREKTSETSKLIRVAKALHAVTKQHNVPLIINDRIDVALAVGAEGVHIGQDDIGNR